MANIPNKLQKLQEQFAQIITMPFDRQSNEHFKVQNKLYNKLFLQKVNDQDGITADERIQFYNRGYWFRLITLLQQDMPLLRHLLGLNEFNELAMTYLENYPCRSQILNNLADDFLLFMNRKHCWNTPLYIEIAKIEFAHIKAFDAIHNTSINLNGLDEQEQASMMDKSVHLQQHCFLIEEAHNLMEIYKIALDDDDDKIDLTPKKLIKLQHWLIGRFHNQVSSIQLHPIQYQILKYIKQNLSLNDAIEKMVSKLDDNEQQVFSENISQWFSLWIKKGIFYINE